MVKCLLATESTTIPCSLNWYSDSSVIVLFWLYTASCSQINNWILSEENVFKSTVTIGKLEDLVV